MFAKVPTAFMKGLIWVDNEDKSQGSQSAGDRGRRGMLYSVLYGVYIQVRNAHRQ